MHLLKDILINTSPARVVGDLGMSIDDITIDSRAAKENVLFIALRGSAVDGHQFIEKAIGTGACAIVCEVLPENLSNSVCYIQVENSARAAGQIADAFYGNPSASLTVVGVTGTNGKTTTATLLYKLYSALGFKCGLISTVCNYIGSEAEVATHTTPDTISIHRLLARMRDAKCTHVFMEVSSHAIHQRRIEGIRFAGGVFTNITHDHLDYHNSFDEYIRVKKQFFDELPSAAFALTNLDDRRGAVMIQNTRASQATYSLRVPATIKGKILESNLTGLVLDINGKEVHCRLVGAFNAYNLLAVYGVAKMLGEDNDLVLAKLSNLDGAPGRFETHRSGKDNILGIIDYAHTPDALINVLATINQLRVEGQQVITVLGCGGDRDRTKRPVMAQVAAEHSGKSVFTSDNPRSEDPEAILDEMEAGLTATQRRKTLRVTDRREAIKTAITLAKPGDVVLVAGKGHETYQEISGVKHHFDDKEILLNTFQELDR